MRNPRDFGPSANPSKPPAPSRELDGMSLDDEAAAELESALFDSEADFFGVVGGFCFDDDDVPVGADGCCCCCFCAAAFAARCCSCRSLPAARF